MADRSLIDRVAAATFEIPREDQFALIDAAKVARDTGIGLDSALGIEPDLPDSARARRDYFLRRAFAHFHSPTRRPPVREFAERIARAARQDLRTYQRRGELPDSPLAACLVLALEQDARAAQLTVRQLQRIIGDDI